jgi:hypothetical protein
MTKSKIAFLITTCCLIALVGCSEYRYAVKYDGYQVEQKRDPSATEQVRVDVTRPPGAYSQLRLTITNGRTEPISIHRRACNLAHGDTIVNAAPLYQVALTEYTYASTRSLTASDEISAAVSDRNRFTGNPYALAGSQQLGFGASTTSSTTVLPLEDVVIFPGQVLELAIEDPVTDQFASGVEVLSSSSRKRTRNNMFTLSSSSNDNEQYIDAGVTAMHDLFSALSVKPYVFSIVYSTLDKTTHRSTRGLWNVDSLLLAKSVTRLK